LIKNTIKETIKKDMQSFQNPVARAQTDNILSLEPASPSPRPTLKQHNDHILAIISAGCKENGWTPPTRSGMIEMVPVKPSPPPLPSRDVIQEGETSMREISLGEETPLKDPTPEPFYRRMLRTCLMTDALSMRANHATVLVIGMCVASMMY
jgi:hypothetical protein